MVASAVGSLAPAGRRAGLDARPERLLMARGAKKGSVHAVEKQQQANAAPARKDSLTQ
jgi:hypothetical protein